MFQVYVLRSLKDGRFYKGLAQDVSVRVKQHNDGKNRSTKGFRPWVLVHKEEFSTRKEARAREKYLKSGIGREWLQRKYGL